MHQEALLKQCTCSLLTTHIYSTNTRLVVSHRTGSIQENLLRWGLTNPTGLLAGQRMLQTQTTHTVKYSHTHKQIAQAYTNNNNTLGVFVICIEISHLFMQLDFFFFKLDVWDPVRSNEKVTGAESCYFHVGVSR